MQRVFPLVVRAVRIQALAQAVGPGVEDRRADVDLDDSHLQGGIRVLVGQAAAAVQHQGALHAFGDVLQQGAV